MRERGIIFSAPMVRAILAGRKTQTRRILKGTTEHKGPYNPAYMETHRDAAGWASICPYGQPGDQLWVKETWAWPGEEEVLYRASHQHIQDKMRTDPLYPQFNWRPSIFMPRWASRISLEVTGVRVERLQDISNEDAWAEGCREFPDRPSGQDPSYWGCDTGGPVVLADTPRDEFQGLWSSINGPESWDVNPWVWVIEFRRVDAAKKVAHG